MTFENDHLFDNILLFARLLRALGFDAGSQQIADWVKMLSHISLARREDFYYTGRVLLVRRAEDLVLFDRAFDLFWHAPENRTSAKTLVRRQAQARVLPKTNIFEKAWSQRHAPAEDSSDLPLLDKTQTYSAIETLYHKKFEEFTDDEIRMARRLMAEMVWRNARRTCRYRPAAYGHPLDWRRMLRRNLKWEAEFFELPHRTPKYKPRPLVVLVDISGSMERYTRVLLHWIHALTRGIKRVEAFTFGTRLTRITPYLRTRDVDAALASVSAAVGDWSGGTRIGESLKTFNFEWARRVLRSDALVLIISDGWDIGDLDLLRTEIERLQQSCYRLVWLNPLLGSPTFEPAASGMAVALPFVDDFLPIHNLESLEMIAQKLTLFDAPRPARRQYSPWRAAKKEPAPAVEDHNPLADLQMGRSDYVRRTMVMRQIHGQIVLGYSENPT